MMLNLYMYFLKVLLALMFSVEIYLVCLRVSDHNVNCISGFTSNRMDR